MIVDGHDIRVETKNENQPGLQEITGFFDDDEAITASDSAVDENFRPLWRITSSRTIPTTINGANAYLHLIRLVVKKVKNLKLLQEARNDLLGSYLYHMEKDAVYKLLRIDPSIASTSYLFQVIEFNLENITKEYSEDESKLYATDNIDDFLEYAIVITDEELNQLKKQKLQKTIDKLQLELMKI